MPRKQRFGKTKKETIKRQVASLFLWPQTYEIPILDPSLGAAKKRVGLLQAKVLRAEKLLNMDLLSTSDPYVKLSLSGERLPAKTTSIKMNNLNPEWNEEFKLTVKDPQSQVLQIHVYDWEKVGRPDKLGMQLIPLKLLVPHERKEFTMNLLKNINPNYTHDKKQIGKIMLDLTFVPFKEDYERRKAPHQSLCFGCYDGIGCKLISVHDEQFEHVPGSATGYIHL
ncbi:hypothetical protein POM88_036553 [Heracleum sosnowskyi]|uniref:C2 domain-containing protein n=1 Tax=Heracleum sosnowskyi TaxID=360622 RepID=A0AAD8HNM2_9APIA|nr:hypothetical protein POM88_036553 [Heracleum sosnowskyi]